MTGILISRRSAVIFSGGRCDATAQRVSGQRRRRAAARGRVNTKAKGSRAERRAIRLLEAAGYCCTRAGASLGVFDVLALGAHDIKAIQVKAGTTYCSASERERLQLLPVPPNCSKKIWRFPDRCRTPFIERP